MTSFIASNRIFPSVEHKARLFACTEPPAELGSSETTI